MLTRNDFERWEETITTAAALEKEIANELRFVWDDYEKIYQGPDQFPDIVKGLDKVGTNIRVYGWVGRNPDIQWCYIPVDFAFSDKETRAEIVRKIQEKFKAMTKEAEEESARVTEEKDRAEYERLQAKFGSGSC